MCKKTHRLILQSNQPNCTSNSTKSSHSFQNIPLQILLDDDYNKYDHFKVRLLEMQLNLSGDTFASGDFAFNVRVSDVDALYQLQNSSLKPDVIMCSFNASDFTVPRIIRYENNTSFTIRKLPYIDMTIDYRHLETNALLPVDGTDVYGDVNLLFQISGVDDDK